MCFLQAQLSPGTGFLNSFSVLFSSSWPYLSIVVVKTKKKNKSEKLLLWVTGKSQGQRYDWDLKVPARSGFESQPCFLAAVLWPRAREVPLSISEPNTSSQHRNLSRPCLPGLLEDLGKVRIQGHCQLLNLREQMPPPMPSWLGGNSSRSDPPRNHGVSEPQGPLTDAEPKADEE